MNSNMKYTCRTCLESKSQTECVNISLNDNDDHNSFVLEMLSFTIPELDVFLVNNPVVCGSCIDLLKTSFNFKTICLKNEEYLLKHSQNNNKRINISEIPLRPQNKTTNNATSDKNAGSSNSKTNQLNNKIEKSGANLCCESCHGCKTKNFSKPSLHKKVCVPPFSCYNCDKSLDNIQDLRKHVLTHVKQRKCKICHKRFRDLHMLKVHLRVHTRVNPYKCNLCNKSFRQYYSLKQHLDKHVGSNNVSCKYCSKVFSTKYNAMIHMKRYICKGTCKSLEKCDLCGEKFPNKPELIKHLHSSTEFCRGGAIKEEEINVQIKEEVDIEDRTFGNILIKSETMSELDNKNEDDDIDIMNL